MSVLIIDYGMCNLGSVKRAFEECGATAFISDNPRDAEIASHLVLPGVGAFGDAMRNITAAGWHSALRKYTLEYKVPLLGICLGMQLLAEKGFEGGEHTGLSLIEGEVMKIYNLESSNKFRVPHIGWNEIDKKKDHPLLAKLEPSTDFYFVHSYFFNARKSENILTTTHYGLDFPSIVSNGNIMGVQFHPEKSSRAGFQIIKNFLSIN
ncbi:MAG: imidazole glycerol phosphate synthase subunit HisH [Cyclobacteriaceae bacterium]|nr:imidazole glycerol phosphate synthase subunit HisH [Cyclobacteriaceae bacterium]